MKDSFGALAQLRLGDLRGNTKIEQHLYLAGNHIGGAGTAVNIGYLKGSRGKKLVPFIPALLAQLRQGGGQLMNGVHRQVRVSHMPLHAPDGQSPAQRAAATVLNHIAQTLRDRKSTRLNSSLVANSYAG